MDSEQARLLPSAPPPQYNDVAVAPAPADNSIQQPPPYNFDASFSPPTTAPTGNTLYVQCRVCQHIINVPTGTNSRVVKCPNCQEATPIADPPPGKKYVRCPCNCLLTCSSTASRVICPRPNCKRTIGVGAGSCSDVLTPLDSNRIRVVCGKCSRSILWPAHEVVARCPHCRCRSYLHRDWMMRRAVILAVIGFIFLAIGIGVTAGTATLASEHGGIIVVYVGAFVTGILLLLRSARYACMTHSHVQP
ncbi:type 1 phosphatidylinositol 4,5-bisphosphate 4-phosphatase-like [Dysidea avara]|uniref:type 1 phosphatidylinositol 4,5-bisphosphate 4-phosphatase-like n=1 Tax=Dysidea avara TaxID=196820 RepID=UPI00332FFF9D